MRDELTEAQKERQKAEDELRARSRELGLKQNYPHLFPDTEKIERERLEEIHETQERNKAEFMDNLRQRVVTIVKQMELNEEKTSYILNEFRENVWKSVENFFRQVSEETEERIKNYKKKAEEMTQLFKKEVNILHKMNQQSEMVLNRFIKEAEKSREAYEEYKALQEKANQQIEKYNAEALKLQKMRDDLAKKMRQRGFEVIGY